MSGDYSVIGAVYLRFKWTKLRYYRGRYVWRFSEGGELLRAKWEWLD